MPREKFRTLTEQMYYILLCLHMECNGVDIMEKVNRLTEGRIRVGPGTLYHLLESFCDAGMITETKAEGRKKSYMITDLGRKALLDENLRLHTMLSDYQKCMEEGEFSE